MEDNIVKSTDVNPTDSQPKKVAAKKAAPKATKVSSERNANEVLAKAPDGYKFILFDSGTSYITASGYKFSTEERIHLLPEDEADWLLRLENFRIPDQLELEEYAKKVD